MSTGVLLAVMVFEVVLIGGLMLLNPRIARRGLLFGVYVGEEAWSGDRARGLVHGYTVAGLVWMVTCVLAGAVLTGRIPVPVVALAVPMAAIVGFLGIYLWAYFRSRELAVVGGPPPAAAVLVPGGATSPVLPLVTLLVGTCCGVFAVAYAAVHYAEMPALVPTHFGPSGAPDAWRPKGLFTVMMPSLLTLVLGVGTGGLGFLITRAKRAVRYPAALVSAEAQARFRLAMTRYICVISLLVTGLLTSLSVGAVQVGLGGATALPRTIWVFTGLLLVLAVGGTLYIAIRYGQGGARLERGAASSALTNGLADNRYWVLGTFYVNRDDPAIMVEHRFGLGYTLNLGNWKAIALLVAFLGLVLGLVVIAVVTG